MSHFHHGTNEDTYIRPGMPSGKVLMDIGNVGIGTTDPKYKLSVSGGRFNVEANGDYYGFWVDNKARSDNPKINVGEWFNSRGSMLYNSAGNYLSFETRWLENTFSNTLVMKDGKVGVGTTTLNHAFSVNGTVKAKEIIVDTGWSDFVFEDGYELKSLSEVESHIEEHGHLPDVPSAEEVESEGLSVGEAQKLMMQKIEELTLYVIEQQKQIDAQQKESAAQQELISKQQEKMDQLLNPSR